MIVPITTHSSLPSPMIPYRHLQDLQFHSRDCGCRPSPVVTCSPPPSPTVPPVLHSPPPSPAVDYNSHITLAVIMHTRHISVSGCRARRPGKRRPSLDSADEDGTFSAVPSGPGVLAVRPPGPAGPPDRWEHWSEPVTREKTNAIVGATRITRIETPAHHALPL